MTKDEAIKQLIPKLKIYQNQLLELNQKLKSHEDDYVYLENAEEKIAQSNAILDYYSHLEQSLSISIENIVALGTKDIVANFQELFKKFDNYMTEEISNITSSTNEYMEELNNAGKKIDVAKEEIGHKIEAIKKEINTCETLIADIQSAIG